MVSRSFGTYDQSTVKPSNLGNRIVSYDDLSVIMPLHSRSIRPSSHHRKDPTTSSIRAAYPRNTQLSFSASFFLSLTILLACCSWASASPDNIINSNYDPRAITADQLNFNLAQLASAGTILVDLIPEASLGDDLEKRGAASGSVSTTATTTSSAVASSLTADATSASSSPLPTVFDTGIGNNFTTATCPTFINNFLADSTFKSCLPFSLLIDTSVSFFRAEQSLVRITQVLDATCAANSTMCASYLTGLVADMDSASNCGPDLNNDIPVAQQIRLGLLAYNTMYAASCLKEDLTGSYCFANAITNSSSPTDSYIYYLPLNQSLVGGSQPTCNKCLQETMGVFQVAAANTSNTVSGSYQSSAKLINELCGPGFVNATIPVLTRANAAGRAGSMSWIGSLLVAAAMATVLL